MSKFNKYLETTADDQSVTQQLKKIQNEIMSLVDDLSTRTKLMNMIIEYGYLKHLQGIKTREQ